MNFEKSANFGRLRVDKTSLKSVAVIVERWNFILVCIGLFWCICVNMELFRSLPSYRVMMKYVASSWVLPQWGGNFGLMATVSLSWGAERFSQATEKLRPNDSDCGCVDSTSCRFYMQSSLIKVVSAVRVNDSLCNSQKILMRTGNSLCWLGCLRTRLLEPSSFLKRWLRARFGCPRTFDRYQLTFGQLPGWSCQ